jgi:polyisoprenyl-phosphate glycosyltransferase
MSPVSSSSTKKRITIVTPVYNESDTIPDFYKRVADALNTAGVAWRILFVDDGSTDDSLSVIQKLRKQDASVGYLSLSRNFEHQAAITAGLSHATGDAVIIMDSDLQDNPEAIPQFLAEWQQGTEVVYAIREKRKESPIKVMFFSAFYRIQRLMVNLDMPLDAGMFCLLDQQVVKEMIRLQERNRYLPGLRSFCGFRQTGIVVKRAERFADKPRVTFWRLVQLATDGIFAFSTLPLGLIVAFLSFSIGCTGIIVKYVFGHAFLDWPFGLTTIFFFGGFNMICMGLIGEYVGRIYEEVKARPIFINRHIEITPWE